MDEHECDYCDFEDGPHACPCCGVIHDIPAHVRAERDDIAAHRRQINSMTSAEAAAVNRERAQNAEYVRRRRAGIPTDDEDYEND